MPCLLIDGGETIQLTIAEAEAEEHAGRIALCETCCEGEPETTAIYHRTEGADCDAE